MRKLISVEIKLGFLFVPAKAQPHLPQVNSKVMVTMYDRDEIGTKELSYNSDHNRIFGLTNWYRELGLETGDFLKVTISDGVVSIKYLNIKRANALMQQGNEDAERKRLRARKAEKLKKLEEIELPSPVDISNLSTQAKGNIIEDRVKEMVMLYGQGLLNIYKPVIDNEGIDLIVLKNGEFHPLFLQVKSRYNAVESGNLTLTLSKTFKAHESFYVVGVAFNSNTLEVENRLLCVPSLVVEKEGIRLQNGTIRIVASLNPSSNDKWSQYMTTKEEMVNGFLEKFAEMGRYYK